MRQIELPSDRVAADNRRSNRLQQRSNTDSQDQPEQSPQDQVRQPAGGISVLRQGSTADDRRLRPKGQVPEDGHTLGLEDTSLLGEEVAPSRRRVALRA